MKPWEPSWWSQGNCVDTPNPEVFSTQVPRDARPHRTRDGWYRARAVCADCPVKLQCLEDALREDIRVEGHGGTFQAGLTPGELDTLRRRAAR